MKTGTKIGWALVAVSIIISVWVLAGGVGKAESVTDAQGNVLDITGDTVNSITSFISNPVVIPSTVTNIAPAAFQGETEITTVEANSVLTVGDHAFDSCTALETIHLNNVISIGNNAFDGCTRLSSIEITDTTLQTIGSQAFRDCVNMSAVTIPSSVTSISTDAFSGCRSLGHIAVNGTHYASDGVALYTPGYGELLIVPPAAGSGDSSYVIHSGCTSVGANALAGCSNIEYLYVPSSVTAWGTQTDWAPSYILLENNDLESAIYNQIYHNFDGNGVTSIVSYDYRPITPTPGPTPEPSTDYTITSIVQNADGTVTIYYTAPGASPGSTVDGVLLDNGVNCNVALDGTGSTITLTSDFVNSLRPSTGTRNIPVSLIYTDTATGTSYTSTGSFNLNASGSVDPVTTYTITPEYHEMYRTDGAYVMNTTAPYGTIASVVISNNGNQDVTSYCTFTNTGTGTRITVDSGFISGLTPGAQYTFKVSFNDGKAAVSSKLKIKTTSSGSGSSSSSGSGSGSSSSSGTTSTSGTGTVSNLYGNGTSSGGTTTASSATGTSHLKDTTPGTADGWDARLAFAIAVLLAGVVILMLSRRNAAKLETIRRDRERADS